MGDDVESFEEVMVCVTKARDELVRKQKQIQIEKQEVRDEIDELLALIDEIPAISEASS